MAKKRSSGTRGPRMLCAVATGPSLDELVRTRLSRRQVLACNDPANPKAIGAWPDGPAGGRPRAATIAIRRQDGGQVGT